LGRVADFVDKYDSLIDFAIVQEVKKLIELIKDFQKKILHLFCLMPSDIDYHRKNINRLRETFPRLEKKIDR